MAVAGVGAVVAAAAAMAAVAFAVAAGWWCELSIGGIKETYVPEVHEPCAASDSEHPGPQFFYFHKRLQLACRKWFYPAAQSCVQPV